MDFDAAAHDRAVDMIRARLAEIPTRVTAVRAAASAAANQPLVPGPIATAMLDVAAQIGTVATEIVDKIVELLEGVAAPVMLFGYAGAWTDIIGRASDVQGRLKVDQLPVRAHWKGLACDRYVAAVASQSGAAGRVAGMAGAVPLALGACAAAGLAFYVVVGVILVKVIEGLVVSVAAFASEAFSWAGVLLGLGAVEIGASLLIAAVTTLVALLGAQAVQLNNMRAGLLDHSQFPGGHWPRSVVDTYTDATVTDGDAKWSVTT